MHANVHARCTHAAPGTPQLRCRYAFAARSIKASTRSAYSTPAIASSVRQRPSASASVSERKAEKTQAKQRRRHSGRKKKRSCCALTEVVIALAVLNNLSSRGVAIDRPELGPADQRELSGVRDMVRDISSGPSVPRHGTHWTSAAAQEMTETIRVTIPSMTPQRHE